MEKIRNMIVANNWVPGINAERLELRPKFTKMHAALTKELGAEAVNEHLEQLGREDRFPGNEMELRAAFSQMLADKEHGVNDYAPKVVDIEPARAKKAAAGGRQQRQELAFVAQMG